MQEKTRDNLLLRPQTGSRVCDLDAEDLGPGPNHVRGASQASLVNKPLEYSGAVAAAHVVGNFGSKALIVHKEKIDFSDVVNKELLEAIGKQMARLKFTLGERLYFGLVHCPYLLVAAVANLQTPLKTV